MQNISGVLATVNYLNPVSSPEDSTPSLFSKDIFITLGVLVAVGILLLAFIAFLRRKKIQQRHHLSRSAWPASASQNTETSSQPNQQRRHRKRRREHRPRNPTLADTGGLPPKRPDDLPPKSV